MRSDSTWGSSGRKWYVGWSTRKQCGLALSSLMLGAVACGDAPSPPLVQGRPNVLSFSPESVIAGASGQATIAVTGTNFGNGTRVLVGGAERFTRVLSPTQLEFTLRTPDIATPRGLEFRIANPADTAFPRYVIVANAAPVLQSVTPSRSRRHGNAATIVVTGSGFVPEALITLGEIIQQTTRVSATELRAQVDPGYFALARRVDVAVMNGNIAFPSAILPMIIENPVPVISRVTPDSATPDVDTLLVTAIGSDISEGSTLLWNGTAVESTVIDEQTIEGLVPRALLIVGSTANVGLQAPGPGGGASATTRGMRIVTPPPRVNRASPSIIYQLAPVTRVQVFGAHFAAGTRVFWKGAALASTVDDDSTLTVTLPPALVANAGQVGLEVRRHDGQSSRPFSITISTGGESAFLRLVSVFVDADAMTASPDGQLLYVGTRASDRTYGASVLVVDPFIPRVLAAMPIAAPVTRFSVTPDGKRLFATMRGRNAVARFDLQTRLPEAPLALPIGTEAFDVIAFDPLHAIVSVDRGTSTIAPHVRFYDDTVARPLRAPVPVTRMFRHADPNSVIGNSTSLLKLVIEPDGVRASRIVTSVQSGIGSGGITFIGHSGEILDLDRNKVIGRMSGVGQTSELLPIFSEGRTWALAYNAVLTFNLLSGALTELVPVPALQDCRATPIVRWGPSGIACIKDLFGVTLITTGFPQ